MFLVQQFSRTISLQIDYKYIFRDPPRQDRIRILCQHMFPNKGEWKSVFEKITNHLNNTPPNEHTYKQINLRPDSPHFLTMLADNLIRNKDKNGRLGLPSKPGIIFIAS